MRIVIDMQGAQTESRFRGIGRYTMSFAQAVVRNCGEHEVILALNGLFPDTIESIRAAFDGMLPQENIRVWKAPGPVLEEHSSSDHRREVAELVREASLASLAPDVIHVSSLFEGFADDAVASIGSFDTSTPVSVSLYDLIPLLNPDQYLKPHPQFARNYLRKVGYLKKAAVHLAISEFSRQEGLEHLDVPESRVINVSTAIEHHFHPLHIDDNTAAKLYEKFGVTRPFILYTGGADERKNLLRLIQAFAALPAPVRESHQLLLAGKMPEGSVAEFGRLAKNAGLKPGELCFTSYVSDDELVLLYNLCKLFVFPSWHEGFGLPSLEAMACGAPVIGANTTSLPEVIGLDEAMFDPFDVKAMVAKLAQALEDGDFRHRLRAHGLQQAKRFSWDETAKRAIAAWEGLPKRARRPTEYLIRSLAQDRLLTALAKQLTHAGEPELAALSYCLAQNENAGFERQLLLDVSELCQHDSATGVQRVVRSYLKWLLQSPPSGFRVEPVYATRDEGYCYARRFALRFLGQDEAQASDTPLRWQRGDLFFGLDMQHHVQLAHAPFYRQLMQEGVVVKFLVHDLLPIQLAELFKDSNAKELHERWLAMIAATDGAICVSKATAGAFDAWIAEHSIPRAPIFRTCWVHNGGDIDGSKPSRGLPDDATAVLHILRQRPTFLCVSTLEPRKRQQQILDAVEQLWQVGIDVNLVFVGQQGWKIEVLADRLRMHPEAGLRLFWLQGISDEYLEQIYVASTCLIAASLNEGFGLSLIEAARHGVPIIARDIPVFREVAGEHAAYFQGETAQELAEAIKIWLEKYHAGQHPSPVGMKWSTWQKSTENLKVALIEHNYPRRQLLVDISELVQRDARTGIQRVVRSVLKEWLLAPPDGYRVEPVYATVEQGYRYAKGFKARFLSEPEGNQLDAPIEYAPGDIFFGLDLNHEVPRAHKAFLQEMYLQGVDVRFMIYDLLPIQFPAFWEPQHSVHVAVPEWLSVVTSLGGAVCISKAVADELAEWMKLNGKMRQRHFAIDWFHLGADVDHSHPTQGIPPDAGDTLTQCRARPTFLMVGTLEPRKGHAQVLDAFDQLWQAGADINLIIVGKNGWLVEELVERVHRHPELNKHLFWLEGVSDEYLEKIYAVSTCLIAASYGEGFGLPLIEAAQHKLPIIARDIPVFREVAGEYAYYFNAQTSEQLAESIRIWLSLFNAGCHPDSAGVPWLTWAQSAQQLTKIILPKITETP